jgi:hypothetical protein
MGLHLRASRLILSNRCSTRRDRTGNARNNHPVLPEESPRTRDRSLQVVLADRTLVLMPICAWYASCKRNATKPFLVPAEECLCTSLHTSYLFILLPQVKNGKETAPARRFLPSPERGGYPRRIFYDVAHSFTRNRTRGSDFPPFSPRIGSPNHRSPLLS